MAYITYYRVKFTNDLHNEIEVLFQKKDGVGGTTIIDYEAVDVKITKNSQESGKFATVISTELAVTFDMQETDIDYWNDFVNASHDTWKCIATCDGEYIFHGFVLPDEGSVPFQDRPIDATIRATDGLGLLKGILLTDLAGVNFESEDTIIDYILAAIGKTNLGLEVKVYDNVFHNDMDDRADAIENDLFSQTKLDYRTFQNDATTFMDSYEALRKLLVRHYHVYYEQGRYEIKRMGMYQYNPGAVYYTVYSADGTTATGFEDTDNYAQVGKDQAVFPSGEDQIKTAKFAIKTAKTFFDYNIWPELPKNNKFERGAIILAYSGIGYSAFELDDWAYGTYSATPTQNTNLPAIDSNASLAYRLSTYNIYGIETERQVIMEEVTAGTRGLLLSEGIPVVKGDKITISFDRKTSLSGTGTSQIAMIFMRADPPLSGDNKYFIESQNTSEMTPFYWITDTGGQFISKSYGAGENFDTYTSFNVEPPDIPANGTLWIGFITPGVAASLTYIKNFNVEYKPYVAGGYIEVKGDYWTRLQNPVYPDKSEEEIFLSDNPHKVFKGCLLDSSGVPFNPDWKRYGLTESRHFKELTNIAEYNHYFKRFWGVEGTFTGLTCAPQNNPTNIRFLSLHLIYRFVDIAGETRDFMIISPLEIDLVTGEFSGKFAEVKNIVTDGEELGDSSEFKYKF